MPYAFTMWRQPPSSRPVIGHPNRDRAKQRANRKAARRARR